MLSFHAVLAQQSQPVPGADPNLPMWNTVIMFGGLFVMLYVLMIRPQRKKDRELAALISGVKTGDRVVTSGGIHGVVTNVKDGPTLVLKVDDSCKLTVDKSAIATVVPKDAPAS